MFYVGNRVVLPDGRRGVVSEVVPPGRLPRSLGVRALLPRCAPSYVVTVMHLHKVACVRRMGDGLVERQAAAALGARRLWPRAEDLRAAASRTIWEE